MYLVPYGILCHCDKSFTLEEFQQSMTMLMTLKPYVKDHNDNICFSYFGHDMDVTSTSSKSNNYEIFLSCGSDVEATAD